MTDPIDPTGKRPDQWARNKGHLVFLKCGNGQALDPAHIPFAFSDAGSRRTWPNPSQRPDYRISEAAYDAAIAAGPFSGDARPIEVRNEESAP